jgi:hypothetical protein
MERIDCCLIGRADALGQYFFNLYNGGWNQGPLDTAAT